MRLMKSLLLTLTVATSLVACSRPEKPEPGVASPSVKLSRDRVPLGSPLDITYSFVVAPDAPKFKEAYRVFVGVVDADEQLMWTDDHYPEVPTTDWKPGQTVSYTRTVFVPVFPYVGAASVHMGLYSMTTQKRVPLVGNDTGQHAYRVGRLQLQPQTENVFTIFKDGWHPTEVAEQNKFVEWQWTKKNATLAFRNPKKDSIFYLDLDNPGGVFDQPQQVTVRLGDQVLGEFTLTPRQQVMKKIPISAAQLGSADMAELHIEVDKTFVPALLRTSGGSKDPRELGVRVFHAFVQPIS
jgi:hypothetical protein